MWTQAVSWGLRDKEKGTVDETSLELAGKISLDTERSTFHHAIIWSKINYKLFFLPSLDLSP